MYCFRTSYVLIYEHQASDHVDCCQPGGYMHMPNQSHSDHIQLATIRGDLAGKCDETKHTRTIGSVIKVNLGTIEQLEACKSADMYKHDQYL